MPIDPTIAMSYRPISLDVAGAYQAAQERKALEARNALVATQQAAAQDEMRNALAARQYAAGADLNDPQNAMRLFGYGKEGADMYQSLQAGRASSAAARKSALEAAGVKAGQYRQMLSFVNNPNDAAVWLQMHHDDPDMADSPVARMPLDVALSRIPQDPAGFQKWREQAALGIDEYIKRNTMTAEQQSMEADRAAGRSIERERLGIEQQREQRLGRESAGGVVPPKLKPGERWNAQTQTVEAVPGSAEYIKQSQLHTKDRSSFTTIKEQRALADKKIDYLLSPKNADAFSNLFGGYTEKFISSKFSGATASAKTQLDSLKSNIKNAGLRLIQQGGKIGAITEREWPILEGMIAGLDSTMEEKDARETLNNIKAFFKRMESNAAEEYQGTWGNTQYYNPTLVEPAAPAGKPKPEDDVMAQADAILAGGK